MEAHFVFVRHYGELEFLSVDVEFVLTKLNEAMLKDIAKQGNGKYVRAQRTKVDTEKIIKDISSNVEGKHILIVEEIIDAGRTLTFLQKRLLASNPASLKIAALLDKPARRELPVEIDYVGRVIDDRFVVGYGMDSEELGRNYEDLFIFRQ